MIQRFILLVVTCALLLPAKSQNIVREHYTVSAGILGAANFSKFRVADNDAANNFGTETGWSAGAWINFPLANSFSLEPQVMYSNYAYKSDVAATVTNPLLLEDGKIDYVSVPLLFKFHLGGKVALTLGPQFDFLSKVDDEKDANREKDDFEKTSVSAFGGLELFPHGRVTIFGRYIHGFTDMNAGGVGTGKYHNQVIQAGLKLKLFGKKIPADSDGDGVVDSKDKCMMEVGLERYAGCPIPDTDKDGVNDEMDKCRDVAGTTKYEGCPIPDTDKDGVNDEVDKCRDVAGIAKYEGCPIPDSDSDGVNDEADKCPNQAGLSKYDGCPIPDSDGDGINDEEDRCPNEAGVPEMKGCKKIETFEASQVTFTSGKSVLTAQGKKELDVVVAFIKRAPEGLKIKLIGHTDSTGKDEINDPLSQARADAAKAYMVKQGIEESRISTEGQGSKVPVADNKTKKGKALNRRVEVHVE